MDAEYKDVNESAPIPSLTLEPELENTPKLVVAEETKLQQTKVAEPVLTPQEQQMVNDFAQKIDVENTAQILQYGAGTQKKRQGRGQCGEDWRRTPAASGTAAEGLRDAG